MIRRTVFTRSGRWSMVAIAALMVSACNVTPTYERPKQDLPAAYRNPLPEPSQDLPRPTSEWWTSFGSDELNALVEEALENNRDIKAAGQRVLQAEAQAGSAAAALLPSISVSAGRSVDSPSGGQGTIISGTTNRFHRVHSAGFSASWEADLWGKIRASESSSLATALANVHDREALSLTMVTDLVTTYLQYLESIDREDVARQNIANMKTMHAAVRERVRLGESSELELAQQRNVLAQGEATVPPITLQRERSFNKIALLMGKTPASLKLTGKTMRDLKIPEVSPGIPADLLLRRPDIKKAESNMVAANFNIGVARAKLFPAFTLSGTRGWASQLMDSFVSPASIYLTLATTVTAPVFDFGKNQADIDYAKARFVELAESYQQTVLTSVRDVEDALASVRLEGELEVAQNEVLQAALDAYRLSSEAFRLGMVDYLNLLETQRTRFQAEDSIVQSRFSRLSAVVGLYKAIGGGMERPEDPAKPAEETGATTTTGGNPPPPAPEPASKAETDIEVTPVAVEEAPVPTPAPTPAVAPVSLPVSLSAYVDAPLPPPVTAAPRSLPVVPAASFYTEAN